ncbi:hypothetical protein 2 [Kummerowia striata tombusvirus]|nr:hypothetical protein 2 [Kummerowia striata tombusvirus]
MGPNHDLGVYNNGVLAVERAMIERYFMCEVSPGRFERALPTRKREWNTDLLKRFRQGVVDQVKQVATVLTLREVVECYTGAKRKIYQNAYRSLMRRGINARDAEVRPFTKFEKQSLLKAPRIINPRSPRYNLYLGKWLKKAEKNYYRAINNMWGGKTDHTVIKGLNVRESARVMRQKWDRFKRPVAVGLDAKKFDMHVSKQALEYEHTYYTRVWDDPRLAALLRLQLVNRGVARCEDGEVHFKMTGTRASGDLNTSLGNCILMCSAIWALCQELCIDAELANNGDDCVLMLEEENLNKLLDYVDVFFSRLGFRMTTEQPVRVFEEIEFCQSHPVLCGGFWTMVRDVRTCLKKDPMCLLPMPNNKVWRKWLGAVGECGMATVPGCPVLQSFYECFKRNGTSYSEGFKTHLFKNTSMLERMVEGETEVDDESRASFYRAFKITPDMQIALEHYYDNFVICGVEGAEVKSGVVEVSPPAFLRHL